MTADVDNYIKRKGDCDAIRFSHWDTFCTRFNEYVTLFGSVDRELHYFRNKLNRAPLTLCDLMREADRWVLCSVGDSKFHIHGAFGWFNLKFISAVEYGGKFETVYDMHGVLLTDSATVARNKSAGRSAKNPLTGEVTFGKVDPENMGTYNYANFMTDSSRHFGFDVWTFTKWGNVAGHKPNILPYLLPSNGGTSMAINAFRVSFIKIFESNDSANKKIADYKKFYDEFKGRI